MKNRNIILIVLGILIIVLFVMLCISPLMEKDKRENVEQDIKEVDNIQVLSDNIASIQMGVNTLIDGEGVTLKDDSIKINMGGTYNFNGALAEGTIFIDTDELVEINLNNVTINTSMNAIEINNNSLVTINLNGTNNINCNSIVSNGDLVITGIGSLNLTTTSDSIVAENLSIRSGKVTINSEGKSFDIENKLEILSGTLIALGKDNFDLVDESIKQKTVLFNLENTINANSNLSLLKEDTTEVMSITLLKDVNCILISSNKIINGNYYLYNNYNFETKEGENIFINSNNLYEVNNILTKFGN